MTKMGEIATSRGYSTVSKESRPNSKEGVTEKQNHHSYSSYFRGEFSKLHRYTVRPKKYGNSAIRKISRITDAFFGKCGDGAC